MSVSLLWWPILMNCNHLFSSVLNLDGLRSWVSFCFGLWIDRCLGVTVLSINQIVPNEAGPYTWVIYLVFTGLTIVLISLILAYQGRNRAYKLVKRQKEKLQILNTRLTRQSDELSELNESKDRLISVISHDLRSPLASLDSCLQIMLSEDLSTDEKDELIRDLQKETYNTLKTLDDLLAWARLQQKGGGIDIEVFDIQKVINEVIHLYKPVARHKSIELTFVPQEQNSMVRADLNQIKTVVRNLLSNAIKFTPTGGTVQLTAQRQDASVVISIQDEGAGIDKLQLAKIKDPENYYSSKGTAGENGTGVGLMLSFEFIHGHESELKLEPAHPRGTRASFTLNHVPSAVPVSTR